eukprot:RCo052057
MFPAVKRSSSALSRLFKFRRSAAWSVELEKHHKYKDPAEIVNDKLIMELLEKTKERAKDINVVREILASAKATCDVEQDGTPGDVFVQSLSFEQCATLLNVDAYNKDIMQEIYDAAFAIKNRIYGNRIVLFAPLYLSNHCVNQCTYCAFRHSNKEIARNVLTHDQIREQISVLVSQGHRRVLMLTGESPRYTFDELLEAIQVAAGVVVPPAGNIRRINVELPALSVSDMKRLKATDKVGTYTLFQESYHLPTYRLMHPAGPKSDYGHRLLTMDRAMRGGCDDVGIGVLFGLADYRYEVLALLMHSVHLEQEYKAGPHTISMPRMRAASGSEVSRKPPHEVDDANFKKLAAIIRLAVPYTGMILSTRESPAMRAELLKVGISQVSAGSCTEVGGYHRDGGSHPSYQGQFALEDHRTLDEVVTDLMANNYVPSFCTACYRQHRTGAAFMQIAKSGSIHSFCHPNALLTLKEYLNDYATSENKTLGNCLIDAEKKTMPEGSQRLLDRKLKKVESGQRDVYI